MAVVLWPNWVYASSLISLKFFLLAIFVQQSYLGTLSKLIELKNGYLGTYLVNFSPYGECSLARDLSLQKWG